MVLKSRADGAWVAIFALVPLLLLLLEQDLVHYMCLCSAYLEQDLVHYVCLCSAYYVALTM